MDRSHQDSGNNQSEAHVLWRRATQIVRQRTSSPTVWIALQEVRPLTVQNNQFVGGLTTEQFYLAIHLQSFETNVLIEDALREIAGRPLAFDLIEGGSISDWNMLRGTNVPLPTIAASRPTEASTPSESRIGTALDWETSIQSGIQRESTRDVYPTWDKLNERLGQIAKSSPLMKYSHGQARFILESVRAISDTMDLLMPPVSQPSDPAQERNLTKMIERVGAAVSLDPLFISLELLRFRESEGKDIGIA